LYKSISEIREDVLQRKRNAVDQIVLPGNQWYVRSTFPAVLHWI